MMTNPTVIAMDNIEFLFKWFNTPNPMLGNTKPRDMILLGRGHKLVQFIDDAMEDEEAAKSAKENIR